MSTYQDYQRHERQLYVYGENSLQKLGECKVVISGLSGCGAEVAKNLILSGIGNVQLHDSEVVTWADLSSNCFLEESDIGKNRAASCFHKFLELGEQSQISFIQERIISKELLSQSSCFILCEATEIEAVKLNELCREINIDFIYCCSFGLFSKIFVDVRAQFQKDSTTIFKHHRSLKEELKQPTITCFDKSHNFGRSPTLFSAFRAVDDVLVRKRVRKNERIEDACELEEACNLASDGSHEMSKRRMQILNEEDLNEIKLLSKTIFETTFCSSISDEEKEDIVHGGTDIASKAEVKTSKPILIKRGYKIENSYPQSSSTSSSEPVYLSSSENSTLDDQKEVFQRNYSINSYDSDTVALFIHSLNGQLSPVSSAVGAVAAEEVVKALTGNGTPLTQWLFLEHSQSYERLKQMVKIEIDNALPTCEGRTSNSSSLSDFLISLPKSEFLPLNCRYDGQIAVFGRTFQRILSSLSVFVVGCGATGGEVLKQLALMGVGCPFPEANENTFDEVKDGKELLGEAAEMEEMNKESKDLLSQTLKKGKVIMTDMDGIERSNLSRQFLFREKDLHKSKAIVAAQSILSINPSIALQTYQLRVGSETADIFNALFWKNVDICFTTLDNYEGREFVSSCCVVHRVAMIDCGTLGTEGTTQTVVPWVTAPYSSHGRSRNVRKRRGEGRKSKQKEGNKQEELEDGSKTGYNVVTDEDNLEVLTMNEAEESESAIPICTLQEHPYLIQHTIQYARSVFKEQFYDNILLIRQFCENTKRIADRPKQANSSTDSATPSAEIGSSSSSDFHMQLASDADTSNEFEIQRKLKLLKLLSDLHPYSAAEILSLHPPSPFSLSFDDCLVQSMCLFKELFHDQIQRLLQRHPLDEIDSETGKLFWGGTRFVPVPIEFDSENKLHLQFLITTALLKAKCLGIPFNHFQKHEKNDLDCQRGKIDEKLFNQKKCDEDNMFDQEKKLYFGEDVDWEGNWNWGKIMEVLNRSKDETQISTVFREKHVEEELGLLSECILAFKENQLKVEGSSVSPQHSLGSMDSRIFSNILIPAPSEKDDDDKLHIDFIYSCSSLRATNYSIQNISRLHTKMIARRITPAVCTTTALVSSLASVELFSLASFVFDKCLEQMQFRTKNELSTDDMNNRMSINEDDEENVESVADCKFSFELSKILQQMNEEERLQARCCFRVWYVNQARCIYGYSIPEPPTQLDSSLRVSCWNIQDVCLNSSHQSLGDVKNYIENEFDCILSILATGNKIEYFDIWEEDMKSTALSKSLFDIIDDVNEDDKWNFHLKNDYEFSVLFTCTATKRSIPSEIIDSLPLILVHFTKRGS
ncbi:putative Ubiquitin-like modifier-activating enzyme 1 E (Uba1E) [Monocercomonoides exilis]|uniref:putative Ubiquitin-like modifier-activating enzyme 1 E (Uba1E) n=1 Tax=Monocercomonoides exilis TaxID=2049356 RepID=UPI00355A561E|nr:putative Ubiquitin-like modifier-activating enzyme 1 E (Uba1E) [Monocercomonoides exilis]|eukprot:MONOS_6118.1-p1 / transcript=MONOS_6118.1 / gene=MONOS_6118 / organism=Monocercomonoides_exilis_PA203 / gene_product=Ubiquitin-like modifier-activating enzyme 1 E (Uba1E) / transcript_product=Ubiquitin-like modifier-activating enzyme 1 E (Uba1E) / location=Mono_scaffold00188:76141-80488(-) / protein_length=1328 / sequence_SO=supercontig / SO=protein_coding / is_pseudo=false